MERFDYRFCLIRIFGSYPVYFRIGFCELDDILNNSIGTAIGVGIKALTEYLVLKKWDNLPSAFKIPEVRPYYDVLDNNRAQLVLKRSFDLIVSVIMLVILAIPMLIIAIMIKVDSNGPVFYRQERVTTYGKHFRIHKFRTMVSNEAVRYVEKYEPEYYATLLLPAGITSEASIRYKDEEKLLSLSDDTDKVYVEEILPSKMKWNLESIMKFGFFKDILTMFRTVFAVLGKEYN